MKPAPVIVDRDMKPANVPDRGVDITWRDEIDPRRVRRIADILADILDNGSTPADSGPRHG